MRVIKYIILILVLISLIGLRECTNIGSPKTSSRQKELEMVNAMRDYLSQKYGTFNYKIEGFDSSGWDHEYDLFDLSVEMNGIEESFTVQRYKTESGYIFEDNYFGLIIRPSFEEKVSKLASEYFGSMHVYAHLTQNYPDNLTKESQIDDLLALDNLKSITIFVIVEEDFNSIEEFTAIAESFVSKWAEQRIPSMVRVIYLSKETFANTDRSNVTSVLGDIKLAEYNEIVK